MPDAGKEKNKFIVDLNILNTHNATGCGVCGGKFNLGEMVVVACGGWQGGGSRIIHEKEAVYDSTCATYYERGFYNAFRAGAN
ncbi:MAG: hypothetical protein JEZ12_09230 [Desulfobacterium sp.]|nr:hypothetical protein [Desulfobacterium sp.]